MAFVTWGGNYCIAQETAYKTLSFPDDNKNNNNAGAYTETWTAKIGNFSWEITNFNNNSWNNNWTYIKAGRQKVASVAKIDNTTPFDKAIGKIVVEVKDDVDAGLVNSICLQVASDAGFSNVIETVELKSYKMTDFVFNVSAPQANLYYRLKFDLKKGDKKKNGFLQVNKVEYYEDVSNKTATSLSFDAPSYTISKDQTLTKLPTLKADEKPLFGKNITWSSDNENVATVDANGTVTGVAAGNAKITAKFAGDDTYKTSTASYEIIVKGAPSLSFPQTSYTVEMSDVFSTPKLDGLPEGVTPAYTSSKEEVATVDAATGEVKIVGVGTTTITVTSPETDIYEEATASYELNVKAGIYKVEFDFTSNNWGLPTTNYKKEEASYTNGAGYTITFGQSNVGHRIIMGKDSECYLIFGKQGATLSLPAFPFAVSKIKVFGNNGASGKTKQNFFVDGEPVSTETTDAKIDHIYEIKEGYQAAGNIYTLKVTNANNTQITKIVVYAKDETIAGAINIATEEGFGTFYTDKNYVLPQGLTAFGYTSIDGNTLTKSVEYVAGDIVPANTAVVVKGAKGSYNYYNTEEVATKTIEKNLLKGVTTDTKIEAKSGVKRYILTRADDGILAFYRTNSGTINVKANRAYLEVPSAMAVASFSLEGSATGINNVVTTAAKQGIYTISGVRLNATTTKELPAGIYIVDGKKVIVK